MCTRLVLASGSPRRRELIAHLGFAAELLPATVEEWEAANADPAALVAHNAALKADWAAARRPTAPILAADTTVALGAEVLNKPTDLTEARAMLRRLAGRTHVVHTGVSLRWLARDAREDFIVSSEVTFQAFDDAVIERYFALVDPLDKAGAYGIQEGRELIVERWEGSLHNIMGLPTERLVVVFEQLGWTPLLKRL
ncbi:MAG: Maf family protein [Opitutales bacterium]